MRYLFSSRLQIREVWGCGMIIQSVRSKDHSVGSFFEKRRSMEIHV